MDNIYRARRKRARDLRVRRGRIFRSRLSAILTVLLFASILGLAAAGVTTFAVYRGYAHGLKSPQDEITSTFVGPSIAYDRNGQKLGDYIDPGAGLRDPVPLNEISPNVIAAVVATEDATFYTNPGVNFGGLARAAWDNLTPFGGGGFFSGSGGSSITQQLVKNVYFTCVRDGTCSENTADKIDRKMKESVIAVELKRQYSDDQILDWYLNQIPYGRNAYGIEAASEQFYGKKASELTLPEATYLVGLPQAPGYYSESPEAANRRQQEVYDLLLKHLDEINKIPTDGDESKPLHPPHCGGHRGRANDACLPDGIELLHTGAALLLLREGPGSEDVSGRALHSPGRYPVRPGRHLRRPAYHHDSRPRP